MTKEKFLEILQCILTMVNENDAESVINARKIIDSLWRLAQSSGKTTRETLVLMGRARAMFYDLITFRDRFVGLPGDYANNRSKRFRLEQFIKPGC